jgi:hypothetical protein
MSEKQNRDVERVYSTSEFVAKLRRLANAIEAGERFEIQVAGERVTCPLVQSSVSNTNERGTKRRSNSSLNGPLVALHVYRRYRYFRQATVTVR